jgi:hypothetical protein
VRVWQLFLSILSLALCCCGTSAVLPQPCDGGSCNLDGGSDAGVDAGPLIELRFRGAGTALALTGFNDSGGPSGGAFKITGDASGFSVAITHRDSFFRFFEAPATPGAPFRSEIIADGATCPDSLASLLAQNMVVLGIGGDPSIADPTGGGSGFCTMLGVSTPDAGPQYSYLSATGVTLDELADSLTRDSQARSYVVTALSAEDSGIAYVAESIGPLADGGMEDFDTRIVTASEADLAVQAADLADAGYVVTASNNQGAQFILVGTRASGSTVPRSGTADAVGSPGGEGWTAIVKQRLADGYAAVSFMDDIALEADGGFSGDFFIIWEK